MASETPGAVASQTNSSGKFLSLHYITAMISAVIATPLTAAAIISGMVILGNLSSSFTPLPALLLAVSGVWIAPIVFGVGGVAFGIIAMLCFKKVSRNISARPNYTSTSVYLATTYGGLIILALMTLALAIVAIAMLIATLLTIGASGIDFGGTYLFVFLPVVLATLLSGFATYCVWKIAGGRNLSWLLSLVIIIVAGCGLVLSATAVAVKSHDKNSPTNSLVNMFGSGVSDTLPTQDVPSSSTDKPSSLYGSCSAQREKYLDTFSDSDYETYMDCVKKLY